MIKRFTGSYYDRQIQANAWEADLYLELHANSVAASDVDYAICVVASNHSQRSYDLAVWYALAFGKLFDVGDDTDHDIGYEDGVRVGGRGNGNLRHTNMPAVLLEPGFASNPVQARMMEADSGIAAAASTILRGAAGYSKIALSVGHKGKPNSGDMGAPWTGDRFQWEAEWAEAVVDMVESLARDTGQPFQVRVGATATLLRATPEWGSVGFVEMVPGAPLTPVMGTDGTLIMQNSFQFFRTPNGATGWVPLSHIIT